MTPPEPTAPGIIDLQAGEETLARSLEALRARIDTHEANFFTHLEEHLTEPLRDAFTKAYQAHAQLMDRAGLGHAGPGSEGDEPSAGVVESDGGPEGLSEGARLRHYREGVRTEVLEPLRSELKEIDVGRTVANRWEGFQNGLPGLADALPQEVLRPEPADLYLSMDNDGGLAKLRKATVRGGRAFGGVFSTLGLWLSTLFSGGDRTPRARVQRIELRRITRDCLLGHCPEAFAGLPEALQQHYAVPTARVEAAIARWTADWFSAEDRVHVGGGHLGARFLELLEREFPSAQTTGSDAEAGPEPGIDSPSEIEEGTVPDSPAPLELEDVWQTLEQALSKGVSLDAPAHIRDQIQDAMSAEWAVLQEELRVAGTFTADPGNRRTQRRVDRIAERENIRGETWSQWHLQVLERFQLAILLLRLREGWDQTKDGLLGGIVDQVLTPLLEAWVRARHGLMALKAEAESHFSDSSTSDDPALLADKVEDVLSRGRTLLASELHDILKSVDPVGSLHRVSDDVANELAEALRFLPDSLSIPPIQAEADQVVPITSVRDLPFREIVQQTVDVLSLEAVRTSPQPLLGFLEGAMAECQEIPTVVSFNLTEAIEELRTPPDGPMEETISDARSLTVEGLARTAQGVEGLAGGLAEAWREFTRNAHDLLEGSFREVHTRAVAEGGVQEQILDLRSTARSWFRSGVSHSREASHRINLRLMRYWRLIRVRGAKFVGLAREAVGSSVTEEGEAERALVILRGIPRLLNSLPLVYRRLYSFQPLSDPALLVGRERETKWVAGRLEAWKAGFGAPCVHHGPIGMGQTSLLNALNADLLAGFKVYRIDLDRRLSSEEEIASALAELLEIPGEGPWSLAGIRPHLARYSAQKPPTAIQVDHLEHLFLRTPGGTDLLADFLSFQAATHRHVFWISTTSSATWKLVEKSEPAAAGLTAVQPLSPFSREDMEELIMVRHRRSGLPVEFRQPGDLNPLVRRKLRLSRGDKAKQEILRTEFFDRLNRMSGGSASAAILLWLRALDFSSKKGRLRVTPPRPIRFAFMEELDPDLDFVLKALIEHGSLTLEEYATVFDVPHDQAYQTFEALRRRMLVEPLGTHRSTPTSLESVEDGVRYRIPGILSHVVANRLRNRNILH